MSVYYLFEYSFKSPQLKPESLTCSMLDSLKGDCQSCIQAWIIWLSCLFWLLSQEDGNVALYAEGGNFSGWATNTGGRNKGPVKLVISDDGVVVLLDGNTALWSSAEISPQQAAQVAEAAQSSY